MLSHGRGSRVITLLLLVGSVSLATGQPKEFRLSPDAPIYQRANIGVVGDYKKVIPAFQKKCEELRK